MTSDLKFLNAFPESQTYLMFKFPSGTSRNDAIEEQLHLGTKQTRNELGIYISRDEDN